jgi:hypothetical protein
MSFINCHTTGAASTATVIASNASLSTSVCELEGTSKYDAFGGSDGDENTDEA